MRRSRGIAAAAAAVLLLTSTGQVLLSPAAEAKPACPSARPDPSSAVMAAQACGGRVEVLAQRTETTQVWARPEGGFSTEIYGGPVRFRKDGAWHPVDLTLRPAAGGVEPVGHPRGLRLAGAATGAGEKVLARVETGGDAVSMLWTGPLPAPVLAANTATYPEVRPGVDLLLTATRLGFEQSLVVKNRAAAAGVATLTVPLRGEGLKFVADGPASFAIRDAAGTTVGRMPAPRMWDSSTGASGERTREKAVTTRATGGGGALDLRLAADQAWLRDPKTKYPVTLDPQVELDPTSDTIVRNDELSTSGKPDHSGADYLAYGKATSYLARSFMQWPSAQLAGARITSATLSLWNWYSGSCAQTGWLVWSATPYTNPIWWDTAPKLLSNDGYSTQTAGFNSSCNDAWVSAGVAPLFQKAANTSAPTVYLGLTSYNESNPSLSWKQVRSLQAADSSQIPVVRINYEDPLYTYGVNYPYGVGAVDYAYSSPDGFFKGLNGLVYGPNRYSEFFVPEKTTPGSDPRHEANPQAVIDLAKTPTSRVTALDINRHLLWDFDRDRSLDPAPTGSAFLEHEGKGKDGKPPATVPNQDPYHVFWFDDNWLGQYVAKAYGRTPPTGLSDYGNPSHVRWRIISGDTNWTPYQTAVPGEAGAPDRLALDGLYFLAAGQPATAMTKWNDLLAQSGATLTTTTRLFTYPDLKENYHVGMFKLLTDQILAHHTGLTATEQRVLALHSVSLRAMIIKNQQRVAATGQLAAWTTDVDLVKNDKSLMNLESFAVNALALGAGAKQVYSPGQAPLQTTAANRYNLTADGILQAVPGTSAAGHMTFGPGQTLAPGAYNVDFVLRSRNPATGSRVANLDVYNARSGSVVAEKAVGAAEFISDGTYDRFVRVTVPITITSADNSLEYRVWWDGGSSQLEVAEIRVR
ncbi:DNRLRE domain-containing protein [Actinoplanes sp. NPDC051513]|uniref:DNRLRE domain-containing protein n=1 Tax=Actinoplanes sp. NPDC051513 TaxID=3363908 RepID=UPI0037A7C619